VLSSSKSDSKQEVRFAARLDALMERVDTLAATVATTASAIAKKDGEIASLRRDLQSRDETLQALVAQFRTASQTPQGGPVADSSELRSLKNAVAALTKEHAQAGRAAQVVRRVDALAHELASVKARVEGRAAEPDRPSEELQSMLATLRGQVEALGGLRSGVTEEQLDRRIAETEGTLTRLSERIDSLAGSVEAATASLGDKEHELAALHRHSTEASDRIESIVDDIREALSALSEVGSSSVDDLTARVERVEDVVREAAEAREHETGELARRIDVIDQRVATVATEVARAKTLWPVALRSLEARLDDAASHARRPEPLHFADDETATTDHDDMPSDDLLAGLRDSLEAMETVAAEMARASDVLGSPEDEPPTSEPEPEPEPEPEASAAAAGATIVPLRASEP
jgi:chromosome segregation ATPase